MAMITNNDYEKSVLIVEIIKELKERTAEKNITDVLFAPAINGYEVSFLYGEKTSELLLR